MISVSFFVFSFLLPIAAGYYLFTLYAAWRFFQQDTSNAGALSPVSIFKPLKGAAPDLYDNLASFCRLDYPCFQLLCGVRDPHDPAIAVIERLCRDFPAHDISLVTNPEIVGSNYKVNTLHHLVGKATYDIFVVSDGDVRVEPDYLQKVISPLSDPRVGLVTCPYRGDTTSPFPALLESLIINTSFIPQVLVSSQVEETTYAFGATIAVKRQCLNQIGGFAAIADYLADDYYLGYLITRAGYRARIVPHVVSTSPGITTMKDLFYHQLRWARTQHNCRPAGHFGTLVTYGTVWAVLGLLLFRSSPLIQVLSLTTLGIRLLSAGIVGGFRLKAALTLKALWLVPLADLFSFIVWCTSLGGNTVRWREHTFRIQRDGRMVQVAETSPLALQSQRSPLR